MGIASQPHAGGALTALGGALALEFKSFQPVGPESDVYALGMLLYRLLAGSLPCPVESSTGLQRAHRVRQRARSVDDR